MDQPDIRELLEAMLSEEAARNAPGEAEVLALVRRERRRRALRHGAIGLAAAACLVLPLLHGNPAETVSHHLGSPAPPLPEAGVSVPPIGAADESIPRLTDEEMLDFLGDAPVALVTRSDGSRALLMLTSAP